MIIALFAFAGAAQAEWRQVGEPGFSAGEANSISLAVDSKGTSYVAYSECMTADCSVTEARVKKFSGADWTQVGAVTKFTGGNANSIKIALDRNDVPFVVFSDTSNGGTARVMKLNGSSWVNVGNNLISNGEAIDISLALDSSDNPSVAYSECVNTDCLDTQVSMKTLNGTVWGAFNGAGFSVDSASYVSLALNSSSIPYVAYIHSDKISAITYDGSTGGWVQVGTADFSAAGADHVSLALNSDGVPYVAFSNVDGKVSVKKFNGSSWVQVGAASFSAGEATDISLAVDSKKGTPYVAYSECMDADCSVLEARVKKFSGSDWTQLGVMTKFTGGNADFTSLALDKNGIIYVAYNDWDKGGRVMQFGEVSAMPWLELLLHKK